LLHGSEEESFKEGRKSIKEEDLLPRKGNPSLQITLTSERLAKPTLKNADQTPTYPLFL
jgi:hypothetical protein